jgi:hypothetical protein
MAFRLLSLFVFIVFRYLKAVGLLLIGICFLCCMGKIELCSISSGCSISLRDQGSDGYSVDRCLRCTHWSPLGKLNMLATWCWCVSFCNRLQRKSKLWLTNYG